IFPTAMSLLASFMSAITILGTPAEIYVYGTQYWVIGISYIFTIYFTAILFMPMFVKLNVTSAYEVSIKHSALTLNLVGLLCILSLCCGVGLVMFAKYSICDPLKLGLIKQSDQLYPLFVMETLKRLKGLPGIFLACVFSGALSTLSSGLNSLAAVVLSDIVKFFYHKDIGDKKELWISQILSLVFGVICIALTYLVSLLGNLLQSALSLFGVFSGPISGLFIVGFIVPYVNSTVKVSNFEDIKKSPLVPFYSMSYLWYTLFSVITVTIVSIIVSLLTGFRRPETIDANLMLPVFDILCPFIPERLLAKLRCHVKYRESQLESEKPNLFLYKTVPRHHKLSQLSLPGSLAVQSASREHQTQVYLNPAFLNDAHSTVKTWTKMTKL
ncbi:unnamed protein product, partial [Didymodactylos carnosus]